MSGVANQRTLSIRTYDPDDLWFLKDKLTFGSLGWLADLEGISNTPNMGASWNEGNYEEARVLIGQQVWFAGPPMPGVVRGVG